MNYQEVERLINRIVGSVNVELEESNRQELDEEGKGILEGMYYILEDIKIYLNFEKSMAEPEDILDIEKIQERINIDKYLEIIKKKINEV